MLPALGCFRIGVVATARYRGPARETLRRPRRRHRRRTTCVTPGNERKNTHRLLFRTASKSDGLFLSLPSHFCLCGHHVLQGARAFAYALNSLVPQLLRPKSDTHDLPQSPAMSKPQVPLQAPAPAILAATWPVPHSDGWARGGGVGGSATRVTPGKAWSSLSIARPRTKNRERPFSA